MGDSVQFFACVSPVKYHRSGRFLTHPVEPVHFKRKKLSNREQCLVGSLAGAAHLSKSNAGVPRSAQAERKSAVEQKGKSRLDRSLQCGRRPRKRGLSILLNGVPSVEQEVSDKLPQG